MGDSLELAVAKERPERLRRGRHVAALLEELMGLRAILRRYRAASHLSTERARRRVLACARVVLEADGTKVPTVGKRAVADFHGLEKDGR